MCRTADKKRYAHRALIHFDGSIACVCLVVAAFCWLDRFDEAADVTPSVLDGALCAVRIECLIVAKAWRV